MPSPKITVIPTGVRAADKSRGNLRFGLHPISGKAVIPTGAKRSGGTCGFFVGIPMPQISERFFVCAGGRTRSRF